MDAGMTQLVELPFDQSNAYLVQDGSVLSASQLASGVQSGKSLLKPELAQHLNQHGYKTAIGRGGFTMGSAEARWLSATSPRTNRTITRKPLGSSIQGSPASAGNASLMQSPGILSLGSRYTPSSGSAFGTNANSFNGGGLVTPSSGAAILPANIGVDREQNYRLAAAIAGTNSRGRPRGRRPLRGQFPVVPIDMVRQLGIEQQVILQPAAPVAMRNKAVLCRPLSMCRKTQVSSVQYEGSQTTGASVSLDETDESSIRKSQPKDGKSDHVVDIGVNTPTKHDWEPSRPKVLEAGVCTEDLMPYIEGSSQTDMDSSEQPTPSRPQYIPIPVPVPIFVPTPVYLYARPVPYTLPFPLPCPIPFPVIPKDLSIFNRETSSTDIHPTNDTFTVDSGVPKRTGTLIQTDESSSIMGSSLYASQSTTRISGGKSGVSSGTLETTEVAPSERSHKRPASPSVSSSDSKLGKLVESSTSVDTVNSKDHLTVASTVPSEGTYVTQAIEPPSKKPRHAVVVSDANYHLKFSYGINAWRHWVQHKLSNLGPLVDKECPHLKIELLNMMESDLNSALTQFVLEVRKPNGECYVADSIFYLCLGIQEYLNENGRHINIFGGPVFVDFVKALDDILDNFQPRINPEGLLVCRIEEEHLWEARQLGHHSPEILLFTILYFNTKHLGLRHGNVHRRLAFWQYQFIDDPVTDAAVLCHLPSSLYGTTGEDSTATIRLDANDTHPERCPVKLLRTYCSHCPPNALSSEGAFYLTPVYPVNTGSDHWYSTLPVDSSDLQVMLNRIKMVKEIQEAFMNGQPDCGF